MSKKNKRKIFQSSDVEDNFKIDESPLNDVVENSDHPPIGDVPVYEIRLSVIPSALHVRREPSSLSESLGLVRTGDILMAVAPPTPDTKFYKIKGKFKEGITIGYVSAVYVKEKIDAE